MDRFNCFIGLFYFVIMGWWIPLYAEKDFQEEIPLLETTQFELLGTDGGHLRLTIKAYQMRQYENGNVSLSGGIEIFLFDNKADKEEKPIRIQADRLSYNKEEDLCMIAGNVMVSKPKQQLTIHTEQLWYDMKKETLFTEVPIVIKDKENILKGSELRATKDLTKYTITAPNGTVDIKQEAVLGS
ncbi:LPS export ABC transporter periplasmic protein LptC [Cardinium endosymbiont of Nabis limbatus]|uniref:LPS export ABC transporter periplasmic protein LptC n=1 Tax=Cardinium endosymbiont of Nabis limbatus TaxID=3066217 RepID=UPI003AF3A363